jgi:hypothetical protein
MKNEINLARRYYETILLGKRIAEAEKDFWRYRFHINWLYENDIKYNERLLHSMKLKRENWLNGKLKT